MDRMDRMDRMTYRDMVRKYFPGAIDRGLWGGVEGCPSDYFMGATEECTSCIPGRGTAERCNACWEGLYKDEPMREVLSLYGDS